MYLMKMRWAYGIFGFISWQFWGNISTKDVDMAFVGYTMAYMGRFRHNCTPVKGKYAQNCHILFGQPVSAIKETLICHNQCPKLP